MSLIRAARAIYRYNDFVDLFFGVCRYVSGPGVTELGIVYAHDRLTRPGDRVVIVGGGDGMTSVAAAERVGVHGSVTIYEGGDQAFDQLTAICEAEDLLGICTIHHAIVGPDIDVYGGDSSSAASIHPDQLPSCDVLELDCEGSEVEILRSLAILPRVIIVEIHPFLFPEDPKWVIRQLEERGYRIVYQSGHDGIEISREDLVKLLYRSRDCGVIYLRNGARSPVVVGAVREELAAISPYSKF